MQTPASRFPQAKSRARFAARSAGVARPSALATWGWWLLALTSGLAACASAPADSTSVPGFHTEEQGQLTRGVPLLFDKNLIVTDPFFSASDFMGGDAVQAFFEATPYGTRSWLADATLGSARVADVLVDIAAAHDLNPLMLMGRMQVEQSLVSPTENPGGRRVDFAFGCGCPDNQPCNETYRGLDKQLDCAATTLQRWYLRSQDGDGLFVMGRADDTLDPDIVVPKSHATASLYAYTPWVMEGQGGNWLVWKVLDRYYAHVTGEP